MFFKKVTIVIVATDESESLIETVDKTVLNCNPADIASFLIVIPDNAGAECIKAIEYLQSKYPNIVHKYIQKHPYIGGAIRDAIEQVYTSHIMFLSADIPTSLDSIPIMISQAKEAPNSIIKISRWLEKNCFDEYNYVRKIFNWFAQRCLRLLYRSNLTDFTSPVLISPTYIYKKILFKEWNFPCLLEMVLLPLKLGFDIKEIPTICYDRKEGNSKNSVLQTLLYLKPMVRIFFASKNKLYKNETD